MISSVEEVIQGLPQSIAKADCEVKAVKLWDRDTVWFDKDTCNALEQSAESLGYSHKKNGERSRT
ncbi:hypothetical protein GCM10020331_070880 [Ectobacillus funiculus]